MKRAILEISDQLFMQILNRCKAGFWGNYKVKENGLPEDVKIIRAEQSCGCFKLLLESESFLDIEDEKPYPELPPPIFENIETE